MSILARERHWTDEDLGGRDRRRTIGNFLNYQLPSGLWDAADPDLEPLASPPPDWTGAYDLAHGSRRAGLQAHAVDSSDHANSAMVGVRLSDRPNCWLNIKAVSPSSVVAAVVDRAARTASWPGLWDYSTLRFTIGRARVEKEVILSQPGHPASFRFSLRCPGSFSHVINADGSISFRDGSGAEWLRSPPAIGWDSSSPPKPIRVSVAAGANLPVAQGPLPTVIYTLNADDLVGAVYPVTLDPTTTISGTTAIEDNFLDNTVPGQNFGGYAGLVIGTTGTETARELFRVATASLPAGTITGFRLLMTRYAMAASTANGCHMDAYVVKPANASWVEGTVVGAGQYGSCAWGFRSWNTTEWAGGSNGCDASGTDYYADASPPSLAFDAYTSGPDLLYTFTLRSSWVSDWRDGVTANGGMMTRSRVDTSGHWWRGYSTEAASNQPYFEIDYTTFPPWLPVLLRRRA